jgi:hypothetical protein
MKSFLLRNLFIALSLAACTSSRNSLQTNDVRLTAETSNQPSIASDQKPQSLMDLPQTQSGGFVLKPGFYETEFKTYCLQPGTPGPRQGDAYLQGHITGYRKDIVESILLNSGQHQDMDQRNIQLLLWSVVSGSDFNSLSYSVQADAMKLLTPKQIFELKGGVAGVVKNISTATGLLNANNDIKRLFETGLNSYEAYERIAVSREQSRIIKQGVKYDQWYKQKEGYYVRYFPESYQKTKIQIYVPDGLLDGDHKLNNEYVVFDPSGQQAIPAFTNAQRLGIGFPVIDIVRAVIKINKLPVPNKKKPVSKENPAS